MKGYSDMKKAFCIVLLPLIGCWVVWVTRPWEKEANQKALGMESRELPEDLIHPLRRSNEGSLHLSASDKQHFYNPLVATTAHGKLLSWVLAPFKPSTSEFQMIAEFEGKLGFLNDATSELDFQSAEGRRKWRAELNRHTQQLEESLGQERYQRYQYVFDPKTCYSSAWRLLNVNDISEDQIVDLLLLADDCSQRTTGAKLDGSRSNDDGLSTSDRNRDEVRREFRERIQSQFGYQVLHDLVVLGHLDLFEDLESGVELEFLSPWDDEATRKRLETEYRASFVSGNNLSEGGNPLSEKAQQMEQIAEQMSVPDY
jgi:hypothetical protein